MSIFIAPERCPNCLCVTFYKIKVESDSTEIKIKRICEGLISKYSDITISDHAVVVENAELVDKCDQCSCKKFYRIIFTMNSTFSFITEFNEVVCERLKCNHLNTFANSARVFKLIKVEQVKNYEWI